MVQQSADVKVQRRCKLFWSGTALPKAVNRGAKCQSVSVKRGKKFSLSFSVVWMDSRGTFVLCTAL